MLQQTLETLEREFDDDNDAAIDAAKAIVECACQVLIREIDDPANPIATWLDSPIKDKNSSFKNWVVATVRLLKLTEARDDPLNKVISQHFMLTEALGRFRDAAGTVSHGKQGFSARLSIYHRRAALLAADALVAFLHTAYLEREPDPTLTLEPYERFAISNAIIDRFARVQAEADEEGFLSVAIALPGGEEIQLVVEPSRFLFGVDREAYQLALNTCREVSLTETLESETEEAVV